LQPIVHLSAFQKENEDENYTEVDRQLTFHSEHFVDILRTGSARHSRSAGATLDRK
jgi:hypothetical protein